jgi:hypothetical protein
MITAGAGIIPSRAAAAAAIPASPDPGGSPAGRGVCHADSLPWFGQAARLRRGLGAKPSPIRSQRGHLVRAGGRFNREHNV